MRVTAVPEATGRIVQPRQLIVTVYGLYSRGAGGWMSVASLVSLLGDLGVDEPAVRSSISRLKRRGILLARKRDGAAGYELSAGAQAILREGDHRIFRRERARLGDTRHLGFGAGLFQQLDDARIAATHGDLDHLKL